MWTGLLAVTLPACVAPNETQHAWVAAGSAAERELLSTLPVGFAEGTEDNRIRVVGTPEELDRVEAAGLIVDRLGPPLPLPAIYPSAEEVETTLADWQDTWPERVERVLLGRSNEGMPLWGVRLGDPGAPVLHRVVSGIHGDEASAVAVGLALGEALLAGAPPFGDLLADQAIWLVPLANPDGYEAGSRFNRNNVDLNRNFSYLWSPSEYAPGTEPFSEPETRALRTLSLGLGAPLGLAMHAGATNLGYVWNHTTDDTVEEDRLFALGQRYLEACTQEDFYLTNGAEWYTTRGDQNDWSYGEQGTLDFTLEVSTDRAPESGDLEPLLEAHLPALAAWFAQPVLLQGQLFSAEDNRGLEGLMVAEGATDPFVTDPTGRFSRSLETGDWTVTVSAPGHATESFSITLDDNPAQQFWTLTPTTLVSLRPDPVRLSQGATDTTLVLPDIDPPDTITLTRPGVDDLNLAFDGTGYPVNPSVLVPGPYTLHGEDWVAPRAVFAGAHDDRVTVIEVSLEPDCVVLEGQGFAEGMKAWGIWGLDRSMIPLEILSRDDGRLVLDREPLPADGTVDLLLVSQGREVAVIDVLGNPELDTAAPPDSGWSEDTGEFRQGPGGRCTALSRTPTGWALVAVLLSLLIRRSRRPW